MHKKRFAVGINLISVFLLFTFVSSIVIAQTNVYKTLQTPFYDPDASEGGIESGTENSCLTPLAPAINDPTKVIEAVNSYISAKFPSSPFVGLGKNIVESSQAAGVNPMLVVAIGHIESSMATARTGGVNEGPGFNAFGRSAVSGQPSFPWSVGGGPSNWYKWNSWQDSVDSTIFPETNSEPAYIKEKYIVENGLTDLRSVVNLYLTGSVEGKIDGAGNTSSEYYEIALDIINDIILRAGDGLKCNVSGGSPGTVSAEGYAFPVGPQKKSAGYNLPCRQTTCHHDGSAAADIIRPGIDAAPVYAITDGEIGRVNSNYGGARGCYSINLKSSKDGYQYWYGHMQNATVKPGDPVKAGQKIAEVANRTNFTSACWGGTPHLHIDRGCIQNGVKMPGGYEDCRDPDFIPLLNKIWEGLPS